MSHLEALKQRLPDYARDLRINLGVIAAATSLTAQQAWGAALASAVATKNVELVAAIAGEAATAGLAPEAAEAAKGAAAIMGMNNVYYRFTHFMGAGGDGAEYSAMPARLRMQLIGKPGVDALDFELWCLAASAITGCEMCVRSHEQAIREKGGSKEAVQDAVRIAAVIHGVAVAVAAVGSGSR